MRHTAIRGHALQHEGGSMEVWDPRSCAREIGGTKVGPSYAPVGKALCECGEWSPELPSTAARQRWHRDVHKPAVIQQMQAANG